jgi:hypothetical protein
MFLAFRESNACDWKTNLKISAKHAGKADTIEYHHVFPKAYLRKEIENITKMQVDDISNLAFIGSETNKKIGARAPKEYRKDFSAEVLKTQQVDFYEDLDTSDKFDEFIKIRRSAIAARLNEFIGFGSPVSNNSEKSG